MDAAPQFPPHDEAISAFHATPGSLRFRVIAYNPETKQDEDCGIIEERSWKDAWSTVRNRYNYPRRMIPITADVIEFPSSANLPLWTLSTSPRLPSPLRPSRLSLSFSATNSPKRNGFKHCPMKSENYDSVRLIYETAELRQMIREENPAPAAPLRAKKYTCVNGRQIGLMGRERQQMAAIARQRKFTTKEQLDRLVVSWFG